MADGWRRWRDAMQCALYGPGGFYVRAGAPLTNFRTAAHTGPLWVAAVTELADRVDRALGRPVDFTVVDMGAGSGELLNGLAEVAPPRWSLIGVDLATRPPQLAARVGWQALPPAATTGLLIATEWLDVVPVEVVERDDDATRYVEVSAEGDERLAGVVEPEGLAWLDRWWQLDEIGDRAEIGSGRDVAWAAAVGSISRGLAVMIDYAADPGRDLAGTLTGYRAGQQVMPVPDGSCDLTADVLVESLAQAGDLVLSQHAALGQLGVSAALPSYDGEPARYLADLAARGNAVELLDRHGLGGYTWLLHGRGCDPRSILQGQ